MDTLGKIISIDEVYDVKVECEKYSEFDGYRITTDKHEFTILIENGQQCCEEWGYFYLNDDEQTFVGAELLDVNLTDTSLNEKKVDEVSEYGFECGDIQFVDFKTDIGVLQFAVYNAHNGYYGHSVVVAKDKDIILQSTL